MNPLVLPEIPRIYIAIAEWLGCLIYIMANKKSYKKLNLYLLVLVMLLVHCLYHIWAGNLPLELWLFGMFGGAMLMYLYIRIATDLKPITVGYYTAFAFSVAEFMEAIEWWLHTYIVSYNDNQGFIFKIFLLIIIYSGVATLVGYIEGRSQFSKSNISLSKKQLWGAIIITISAFLMSNISFAYPNTPFSGRMEREIFYIRTLVQLCALVILYVQRDAYYQFHIKYELKVIQDVLHRQYDQYRISKESIELINRKYHDLKHQINIIRAENNLDKKTEYIDELEKGIEFFETLNKTGNSVLDMVINSKIITAQKYKINMTNVIDGQAIGFMSAMDICTIFGNALDNAIESTRKLENIEKRLIKVAVHKQNNFLIIRFENYYESELKYENGILITTKKNKDYHGYGIKSLQYTVEKYRGTMTIHSENNWFTICILIPIAS